MKDKDKNVAEFKKINILYGRNYSGKTTVSRIWRALETGFLSNKYTSAEFQMSFKDGTNVTHNFLAGHGRVVRVFNEDFVRDNLRFISDPDDSIEPFAILGDDNNKIEKEIEALEGEIGSKQEGKETGLYAEKKKAISDFDVVRGNHKTATDDLDKQLGDKATDRKIGIKYNPERFGDQNYNIQKLKTDIGIVQNVNYQLPTDEHLAQCEKLISEKTLLQER
ncbi:AAA family ATPase [Desulfobacter postgatei]|uniref:AAA family ATPase n=1 Tax=Desulfobacter postgatei TaxID=2293 RepID=UPI000232AAC8|nr:AAA family ATPase [Desulfobacter postgatei]